MAGANIGGELILLYRLALDMLLLLGRLLQPCLASWDAMAALLSSLSSFNFRTLHLARLSQTFRPSRPECNSVLPQARIRSQDSASQPRRQVGEHARPGPARMATQGRVWKKLAGFPENLCACGGT